MKTKLTAGCLSPTIIISQHNITTFVRLHFQEGVKEVGVGGEEGRSIFNIFTTWESVGLDNTPKRRDSIMVIDVLM